jgi:hypothetical protein
LVFEFILDRAKVIALAAVYHNLAAELLDPETVNACAVWAWPMIFVMRGFFQSQGIDYAIRIF